MDFTTDCIEHSSPRIGNLSGFKRFPGAKFATPLLLMYTKRGSVPHLTKDVLKLLTTKQQILSISVPTIITMTDVVKQFNSFTEFVNMQEHPTLLTIQDPAETTNPGFQRSDSIAVWSRKGRHTLSSDSYMDFVEIVKPDIYLVLCDGDTDLTSTSKRAKKAVYRSRICLEKCLRRHNTSETLKSSEILGAVEGGYDIDTRETSIEYLKDKPLFGFVIDGLHRNGPEVAKIRFKEIQQIVQHTINLLPKEKLRVSMGSWNPVTVLELIGLGVDVFDSSYAYLITEKSRAFTFSFDQNSKQNNHFEPEISLNEKRYADDFSPICADCACPTCKHHTKAYIHHLCQTKELLGLVLLMMHNTHHYMEFFEAIRSNLKNGTFPAFKENIVAKYQSYSYNL